MQNKPNLRKSQMNVSIYLQTAYENKRDWTIGQSKPNSNPIKPNFFKGPKWTQTFIHKRIMKMNHTQAPKKQTQTNPNKPYLPEGKIDAKLL